MLSLLLALYLSAIPLALSTPLAAGSPPPSSSSSSSSPSQPLNPISEEPLPPDRFPLSALQSNFRPSGVCGGEQISTPPSVIKDCDALISSLSAFHLPDASNTTLMFYQRRAGGTAPRAEAGQEPPPSLGMPFVSVRNRCKLILDIRDANGAPQGAGAWQRPPAQGAEFVLTSVAAVQALALGMMRMCFWEEKPDGLVGWTKAGWTVAGTGINGIGAGGLGVWLAVLDQVAEPERQGVGCVGPWGACWGGGSVLD